MSLTTEKLYTAAREKKDNQTDKVNKHYYQEIEDYDWIDVVEHFRGLEAIYHRLREKTSVRYFRPFIKNNYYKVLDAGCGAGLILRHLPPGSWGIDINPRNIARAKKYAPQSTVKLADLDKIPLKSSLLDMVICFETIEHLLFPEYALKEFYRVLKKGGLLIGSVPRKSFLWHLRALSSTHPRDEPFHHEFQKGELIKLLNQYFSIEQVEPKIFGFNWFFHCRKI